MGPREGFPCFGEEPLTRTGQAWTPEFFPGMLTVLPSAFLLLLSSQGWDFQGKERRPGHSLPTGVLAGPESHDLATGLACPVASWSHVPLWPVVPGRKDGVGVEALLPQRGLKQATSPVPPEWPAEEGAFLTLGPSRDHLHWSISPVASHNVAPVPTTPQKCSSKPRDHPQVAKSETLCSPCLPFLLLEAGIWETPLPPGGSLCLRDAPVSDPSPASLTAPAHCLCLTPAPPSGLWKLVFPVA